MLLILFNQSSGGVVPVVSYPPTVARTSDLRYTQAVVSDWDWLREAASDLGYTRSALSDATFTVAALSDLGWLRNVDVDFVGRT